MSNGIVNEGCRMDIKELLQVLPVYSFENATDDLHIHSIKMDHREVQDGDLFICIKGFTVDGHDFAKAAVDNGAIAILSERPLEQVSVPTIIVPDTIRALALVANKYYQYPSRSLTIVGITGTNGKTTTTYLLESIFRHHEQKTAIIGTIQLKIGDETKVLKNTTPDALFLQKTFAHMVKEKVDIVFMEVSSHALHLGRVDGTHFDIALFTNLSQDHLDYHKTMDAYLDAKTLLFTGLGIAYSDRQKFAIVNVDDPNSETIIERTMQPVMTYGVEQNAHIRATDIHYTLTGTTFTVETPKGSFELHSKLNGLFNVYNMLAAITVAYSKHVPIETIKTALENVSRIDGRFERVDIGQDFAVIVDYAHTPDSLKNVLQTVQQFAEGKIFVVVGSGGDRDRTKRPLMAEVALMYSDWTIFTSDNPRTEDPQAILNNMTENVSKTHYEVIENRRKAIEKAIQLATTGDVVLIAGKGHETYQEINGVRYDFDDRLVARTAIEQKGI